VGTGAASLRVLIALGGAMAACWFMDRISLVIPLFLGVIAGALSETDDTWRGRLRASLITVALFAVSSLVVELLTPYPLLFVGGIVLSTFTLTMSGALGERYAAIAQATLILAVYTMLGLEQGSATTDLWHEPLLLTIGAAWYGVLSVLWHALFPFEPVEQGLAALFGQLAGYLQTKSGLFEPTHELDIESSRVAAAHQNGRVVIALNQVKELLRSRLDGGKAVGQVGQYLQLFFMAQDIHERASSTHYPYDEFAEAFFHSDVLFRCQHLLRQQGNACRVLAKSIRLHQPFDCEESERASADLRRSMDYLRAQDNPAAGDRLRSLADLVDNLMALENELAKASHPADLNEEPDSSLSDSSPRSLMEAWRRIREHLVLTSPVFRHALRLSLALVGGYGMKYLVHPDQGYWILLTTLFVCQPNYGSTRRRFGQRISGTVLGLIAGWALITLFPGPAVQRLLAVAAGVAFFTFRTERYVLATAAITVMVMCSFNQVVNGYDIIWPRLLDTLIGCAISGLAVFFILPDWNGRQLHKVVAATLSSSSHYLRELMRHYEIGKSDDLAYRVARRTAHDADATLSSTLSGILQEPKPFRRDAELCLRILVASHTLLSYLSALGAHRGTLPAPARFEPIRRAAEHIADVLDAIANDLGSRRAVDVSSAEEESLAKDLELAADGTDDRYRLMQIQLSLICRQIAAMRGLAAQLY